MKPAYTCGTYHRRGTAGCTTHHIRVDKLDELVKLYVKKVRDNSADMLAKLNEELAREPEDVAETERSAANIEDVLLDAQEELKATKRQRVRDIMRHPENEAVLEETYDELEADLMRRIEGLQNQLEHVTDKRNTIIRANRAAKTAMEVFDDILTKPHLEKQDLELIIERIYVYEDHVEIKLKADIDMLLRKGEYPLENEDNSGGEGGASGSGGAEPVSVVQSATHHADKVLRANIVSDGDPLEIFTDKDGEVIFKKYSPIGELSDFAAQICDSLHRSTDALAAVCDRDAVIAVAGGGKRELLSKRLSPELEQLMESRRIYRRQSGGPELPITENDGPYSVAVAAPVVSEGDLMGCILFAQPKNSPPAGEIEYKLAETVAGFLGRQMEAVAQDRLGAALQGININRVSATVCAIGCALAAIAGCLMGAYQGLSANMGDTMNLRILMLVMLAGAGSMNGIIITGMVMGLLDTLCPLWFAGNAGSAIPTAIVVILLLIKPKGFFGHEMA